MRPSPPESVWAKTAAGRNLTVMTTAGQTTTVAESLAGINPAASWWNWLQTTLGLALLGGLLMWAALPPLDWWPLGWIAPVPWLLIARRKQLTGWRPYRAMWLAGFAFWLADLHWLRLPHWATSFGWLALSFYLAFYIPVFIGLVRIAAHRLRISLIVAAPVVWTGLELARGHLLSGFTMGSLAHTQTHWLAVIQIADAIGCYGVSGVLMFAAACLARMLPWDGNRMSLWPVLPMTAVLAGVISYGSWRLAASAESVGARVALIQGSIDITMKTDPKQAQAIYDAYLHLSRDAVDAAAKLPPGTPPDLIVWPETMFRAPLASFDPTFIPPAGMNPREWLQATFSLLQDTVRYLKHVPLLLGIERVRFHTTDDIDHFNSAVFFNGDGVPLADYDKMHLVMFGEYVPFARTFPFLYKLTPLPGGVVPGDGPIAQRIHGLFFSPNICYETVIPHLIRWQILTLRDKGQEPDVLVNLTNDGWFWASSELDLHLRCGVFRSVECRKPLLIAANTGLSAWIDSNGRIVEQGKRRTPEQREDCFILADVRPDHRTSFYLEHGDLVPGLCLAACGLLALVGLRDLRGKRRPKPH
jgi:apolipoprotein N-acyltransferase